MKKEVKGAYNPCAKKIMKSTLDFSIKYVNLRLHPQSGYLAEFILAFNIPAMSQIGYKFIHEQQIIVCW